MAGLFADRQARIDRGGAQAGQHRFSRLFAVVIECVSQRAPETAGATHIFPDTPAGGMPRKRSRLPVSTQRGVVIRVASACALVGKGNVVAQFATGLGNQALHGFLCGQPHVAAGHQRDDRFALEQMPALAGLFRKAVNGQGGRQVPDLIGQNDQIEFGIGRNGQWL